MGWVASLFPWRSCDIWLERLLGVLTCLFLSCLKCLQLRRNCINSSCEASEVFSLRIQNGVPFHLCFLLTIGELKTPVSPIPPSAHIWFASTFETFCLSAECVDKFKLVRDELHILYHCRNIPALDEIFSTAYISLTYLYTCCRRRHDDLILLKHAAFHLNKYLRFKNGYGKFITCLNIWSK